MTKPARLTNRRRFLQQSAAIGAAPLALSWTACRSATIRPDKLRIGVVGVAGRGGANLRGVSGEDIVALCDVDEKRLDAAAKRFPAAKKIIDFRELVELDGIDAVVVSTPDHTHAPAAAAALRKKLHVYCEKPLTHTVREARTLIELAKKNERVTQMGTQIHSLDNYRRVVELIRAEAIGKVKEVFVFCNKHWSAKARPKGEHEVPKHFHWDLWLGPAAERPFHPHYHPANWRRFWDFGGGTLADMGCHYIDLAHWALDLRRPVKVSAEGPPVHDYVTPRSLAVRWLHRLADGREIPVHWHDGGKFPKQLKELGLGTWRNGVLFVGDDGRWLISDYTRHVLGPLIRFADFKKPEPSIAKSIGHHREWIEACKVGTGEGSETTCNFEYSGALTETVLLGTVAYRSGKAIEFDAQKLAVGGSDEAQKLLHKEYRAGWSL